MKNLKNYINEVYNIDVLSGETNIDPSRLNEKEYLEDVFLHIIDDAVYNLEKAFGVSLSANEISKNVINAMERYKNFK